MVTVQNQRDIVIILVSVCWAHRHISVIDCIYGHFVGIRPSRSRYSLYGVKNATHLTNDNYIMHMGWYSSDATKTRVLRAS